MDSFFGLIYANYDETSLSEPELDPGLMSLCTLEVNLDGMYLCLRKDTSAAT